LQIRVDFVEDGAFVVEDIVYGVGFIFHMVHLLYYYLISAYIYIGEMSIGISNGRIDASEVSAWAN